jgi:hypothetical protein
MFEKILHSTSYSATNHYFSIFRSLRTPFFLVRDVHTSAIYCLLHFIYGLFNNAVTLAVFLLVVKKELECT